MLVHEDLTLTRRRRAPRKRCSASMTRGEAILRGARQAARRRAAAARTACGCSAAAARSPCAGARRETHFICGGKLNSAARQPSGKWFAPAARADPTPAKKSAGAPSSATRVRGVRSPSRTPSRPPIRRTRRRSTSPPALTRRCTFLSPIASSGRPRSAPSRRVSVPSFAAR